MVRLKVVVSIIYLNSFFISIPYGAIKSLPNTIKEKICLQISIPYGAIKRAKNVWYTGKTITFQFLMVRLKDSL